MLPLQKLYEELYTYCYSYFMGFTKKMIKILIQPYDIITNMFVRFYNSAFLLPHGPCYCCYIHRRKTSNNTSNNNTLFSLCVAA